MIQDAATVSCPICGSRRVRPARLRRLPDWLQLVLGRRVHRCRECRSRFYPGPGVRASRSRPAAGWRARIARWRHKRGRRLVRYALLGGLVMALLIAFFAAISRAPGL